MRNIFTTLISGENVHRNMEIMRKEKTDNIVLIKRYLLNRRELPVRLFL